MTIFSEIPLKIYYASQQSKFLDLQDKYLHLEGESLALETALEIFEDQRDEISVLQDVLLETDEEGADHHHLPPPLLNVSDSQTQSQKSSLNKQKRS